ncbi:MAG: DNA repair protein RecO [Clostridiales bacterium]|jgi:DNA repair protein RecO (recombination protein O)|nr:DNA repair protein RecO [Clostridiales bacterium]
MSTVKVRGVVLRETPVGESDKLITLMTKERGKISVSARGARKTKSKYLAGTQLFTYSDFVLFDGKHFFSVTQIDIIENFYAVRCEYDKLCCGNLFVEMCDKLILENMPCEDVLFLLLKALQALAQGRMRAQLVSRAFEFKFMQLNGYAPELTRCSQCGGPLPDYGPGFGRFGLLCEDCCPEEENPGVIRISVETVSVIRYILSTDTSDLFRFNVQGQTARELLAASVIFINAHVEQRIKSISFLINLGG